MGGNNVEIEFGIMYRLVLRIAPITSEGVYSLSAKFGCSVAVGKKLLLLCKELNMTVVGLRYNNHTIT